MTEHQPPQPPTCRARTATEIEVTWYSYWGLGALAYELRWRQGPDGPWESRPATDRPAATVVDLEQGAWYDFAVRWVGAPGEASPWSAPTFSWTCADPAFAGDVEVYRQWTCACACTACRWYEPCGQLACRSGIAQRIVIGLSRPYLGQWDEMEVAVLDAADAAELARHLTPPA